MKKLLLIASALLMASVAMAENACIKDGYLILDSKGNCPERNCPGELVKIKKITKKLNETTCDLTVVDWKGRSYVKEWSCMGADTETLKKSLEKQYIGLPTKLLGTSIFFPSFWGVP